MAKAVTFNAVVVEVYTGDPMLPHLPGRVTIEGDGLMFRADLNASKLTRFRPGQDVELSIEPK